MQQQQEQEEQHRHDVSDALLVDIQVNADTGCFIPVTIHIKDTLMQCPVARPCWYCCTLSAVEMALL